MFAHNSILALAALLPSAFAQISDDFEGGWDKSTWPIYAPDCNQGGSVTLDTTVAHSGSNSLKVVGGSSGYCGHIFFGTTDVPSGKDVYVRTWMKHSTPISDGHVTFIVMPDSGLGAGKHLRLSGQMEILEYNRESDDATLPDLSPNGVASSVGLPTDTWECLEYHLSTDGTIETWLNSKAVPGLTFTPGGSNANANGWGTAYKPDISGVYFGWESYGGTTDTIWYDDVAISSTRVGCSAAGGSTGGGGNGGTTTAKPITTTSTKPPNTTTAKPTTTITTKPTTTTTPTTMKTSTKTTTTAGACATMYGQCGGQGWNGPTCCASGSTCKSSGQYYSQCFPGDAPLSSIAAAPSSVVVASSSVVDAASSSLAATSSAAPSALPSNPGGACEIEYAYV